MGNTKLDSLHQAKKEISAKNKESKLAKFNIAAELMKRDINLSVLNIKKSSEKQAG
ncbi:MAG: hypothetical protein MJ158_00835 [Alphaproteobacteria bacterium]|nr:hypothetical protein [Alphaproteobacteria bacterium]